MNIVAVCICKYPKTLIVQYNDSASRMKKNLHEELRKVERNPCHYLLKLFFNWHVCVHMYRQVRATSEKLCMIYAWASSCI